jgi:hypothetical protein
LELIKLRQPREALEPQAFTLEAAEKYALEKSSNLAADPFRLTSFWHLDYIIQHAPTERKTRYISRLAQSENYGFACALGNGDPYVGLGYADHALVGEDSREILRNRQYHTDMDRTALIDVVLGQSLTQADDELIVDQKQRHRKYLAKSRLFADEADGIFQRKGRAAIKNSKPTALVIGAMAGTHLELAARGYDVVATDMAPNVVGQKLGGVLVHDATANGRFMEAADLAIITGMTLPNGTLPGLIETAKTNNTSIMIWAVTGRNFGRYYTEHGVDCVISDPAPFIMLPGPAKIGVWRRKV